MSTAIVTAALESVASQTFTVREDSKKHKTYVEATRELIALHRRARELKSKMDAADSELSEIKEKIGDILENVNASQIRRNGTNLVSFSVSTPNRLDTEAFEAAHPGLLESYKRPGKPQRTVRFM